MSRSLRLYFDDILSSCNKVLRYDNITPLNAAAASFLEYL